MRLSRPLILAAALLALAPTLALAAAEPQTTLPDVEDEVMCVECGTALNVSTSPVADRERAFIRRRIAEGMSKSEIKAALVEEYGPRVLAVPSGGGFDVAAWLVPGALALVGLLGVGLAALRWRRARPPNDGEGDGGAPGRNGAGSPDLDPDDRRRLDADLAAFDR
jgi:cytochrome c-type biogenesis protein CcmH